VFTKDEEDEIKEGEISMAHRGMDMDLFYYHEVDH
jgi:hypothetical protein